MTLDIRSLSSADAAEFFEQAIDTFSQIGEQAYRFFSDLTCTVSEQVSETSEAVGDTFNEVASSVSKTAVNVTRCVADIFSSLAQWAQENPAYAIGGLIGIVATGFGIYYLVGIVRSYYNFYAAQFEEAGAEKHLEKMLDNYFIAVGCRYAFRNANSADTMLVPRHRFQQYREVRARQMQLGPLNSLPTNPSNAQPTSIGHHRFLYIAADQKLTEAIARVALCQRALPF